MHKDLLVLFGGWTRPSPYPLHQPERFFDEIHTYSPSKNWWERLQYWEFKDEVVTSDWQTLYSWILVIIISLLLFSQVELYRNYTWTSTYGWPLFLCDWKHHGGVWGITRSTANVWMYYLYLITHYSSLAAKMTGHQVTVSIWFTDVMKWHHVQ